MATVTAKCVACEATREIKEGEVEPGEQPMCKKCGSPMYAIGAAS